MTLPSPRPTSCCIRAVMLAVAAMIIVGISAPTTAQAADPAMAKKLMGEARTAVTAKDYASAIKHLDDAVKHLDHPSIHFARARVLTYMVRLTHAEKALKKCEEFELPRKLVAAIAKQREAIDSLKSTHGRLVVAVTPDDAQVQIVHGDERKTLSGDVDVWMKPEKLRLEVSADGYAPAVRPATLEGGKTVELKIALRPLMGAVKVTVSGGLKDVKILLDGDEVPLAEGKRAGDVASFDASPGAHEVVCMRGKKRDSKVMKVIVNQTTLVRCDGVSTGPAVPRAAMGWGAVGVGALLAGLGSYHIGGYFNDSEYATDNGLIASKDRAYGGTAFVVSGVAIGVASYLVLLRKPAAASTASWRFGPPTHAVIAGPKVASERVYGAVSDPSEPAPSR